LTRLYALKALDVDGSRVTPAGIERLKRTRPSLKRVDHAWVRDRLVNMLR
jgi:hypothetical protein